MDCVCPKRRRLFSGRSNANCTSKERGETQGGLKSSVFKAHTIKVKVDCLAY
jgi:hypothetical protein